MSEIWLTLDGNGPRFRQLYRAIREAIRSGALRRGARAPATRVLAADLGLSRTTVLLAYEQLAAEGYLSGRHGSGSYVQAPGVPAPPPTRPARKRTAAPRLSRLGTTLVAPRLRPLLSTYVSERPVLPYDFRYGAPSIADFPIRAWQRALGRRARRAAARSYDYGHPQGSPALREALAAYLHRARGVPTDPAHILIVRGSQQALDLAARVLLDPGDAAVVEEPGFEGARNAFRAVGARLVLAPVDADGFDPQVLDGLDRHARLVLVTPSHQYPLGGVLPFARRSALLAWAARRDAWVLEDDYDGDCRYEGRPLAPLKALDEADRVLYIGTFSKVMFPALRLGYMVLPPDLVEAFVRARALADGGLATLEQEALADFIANGDFERHVRRLRARCSARRAALLDALVATLGDAAARLRRAVRGRHPRRRAAPRGAPDGTGIGHRLTAR